ncbi:protocadherin alpha-5-like [Paramisgurnus dabryanus]|uniref:protocadherin alpha-5-like n=1 Tax=Paramisgurnus dabryanus TaxID=90735 RepID=UPI0031F3A21B
MGQRRPRHSLEPRLKILFIAFSLVFGRTVWGHIRYSISEEQKDGAVVGNIAKDLGIDYRTLNDRRCRIVSTSGESLFSVNQNDGMLYVNGKIDREAVCEKINPCLINLKIALENPLEIHYVTVDIIDVNDHAPSFTDQEMRLEIYESVFPGARFQLQASRDPDSGSYSVQIYKLSHTDYFRIEIIDRDEDGKVPVLILQKPLDREITKSIRLQLTALDGGKPPKSGTMDITIDVLDINDNAPVFTKDSYNVVLNENTPVGTTILRVNATDSDEGQNGEVVYALGHNVNNKLRKLFEINPTTGDIIVTGLLDFEIKDKYQIDIKASDKGIVPLTTDKIITIKIADVNDNAPQIEVTSFSESIPEDSKPGTTVALISVSDLDSEVNGRVSCSIPEDVPFKLMSSSQDNTYSLVTTSALDRETTSHYEVMLVAKDAGQPPLSSVKTITVQVSDVNDNSPEFSSSPYAFYVMENNVPGKSLFSVSASDKDGSESGVVNYQIWRDIGVENKYTSFININSENGEIYALKSFDFETVKTFQFHVLGTDSGSPSLSSNVTVNVFILDQNDNVPVILYPVSANGSAEGVEEIPRNVNAGHLVTKVRAYDADIGYNGWLLFSLQEVSDHSLFGLDRYTGQIRTLRSFTETDEAQHKLAILVKDNGNVSLSATATVIVKVVEPKEAFAASDVTNTVKDDEENNVTFYLIITLGSVSVLFIISIIVLIAMQCSKSSDYSSKYLQDVNYDGTLCHSIQYRSGDKRYMLVGPRMSVGSTLAPGSNRNTLVIPDRRRRDSGEVRDYKVW